MARRHLIGLLLATEEDWPAAFESVLSRIGSIIAGEPQQYQPPSRALVLLAWRKPIAN